MKSKFSILVLYFGVLLSCTSDNEKTIFVADTMVKCTGVTPQECLQIKEKEENNWSNYYSSIEGFDYEEGYTYKLKVEISKIKNPPTGASSEKYVLIEVLEKIKTPVSLTSGSWLVTKIKDKTSFERNPTITLTMPQGQITGSTGCNKYFGNVILENNNFKVNTIGSTKMACATMDAEQRFLQTLNEIETYKIQNDMLQLLNTNKTVVMECDYLTARE
ncbi:MAG TPA: DUF4377 domain-containing protein [Aquaticitalea sp.]|nr:DUF4377 domain-containing protein [Aquaticitalea sp.]